MRFLVTFVTGCFVVAGYWCLLSPVTRMAALFMIFDRPIVPRSEYRRIKLRIVAGGLFTVSAYGVLFMSGLEDFSCMGLFCGVLATSVVWAISGLRHRKPKLKGLDGNL